MGDTDLDNGARLEVGERHERTRQHRRLERDLHEAVDVVEADDPPTVDATGRGAPWTQAVSFFILLGS